jgi:hypothetical protein
MSDELKRNQYTGMDMAVSNSNGEVVKVEDLINKPQKEWEQFTPKDTLESSDSELYSVYERLSEVNRGKNESYKLEDFMNRGSSSNEDKLDDLSLNKDELINNLTGILN